MLALFARNPLLSAALAALVAALAWGGVQTLRLSGARADSARAGLAVAHGAAELAAMQLGIAKQREQFERDARATEQRQREALDGVAATYEGKLTDANEAAARDLAALRAGNLRLRDHWQGCLSTAGLAEAAERGARADELAELRRESAARIVRVGAECDARVTALQSAIRVMQGASR